MTSVTSARAAQNAPATTSAEEAFANSASAVMAKGNSPSARLVRDASVKLGDIIAKSGFAAGEKEAHKIIQGWLLNLRDGKKLEREAEKIAQNPREAQRTRNGAAALLVAFEEYR